MKLFMKTNFFLFLGILFIQISSQNMASATAANFDTLQQTLSGLTRPGSVMRDSLLGYQYSYVQHHALPTVTRLASVCSFKQSTASDASLKGLMHMKGENIGTITSYDQGVIVAIQNNTGDQLSVNQVSAAATNKIGSLTATGTTHYFLHTASLMPASTSAGSQDPVPSNMIEISDVTAGASSYVQVVSSSQLQSLVASFNLALNNVYSTTGYAFAYNEQSSASSSYAPTGQYLLLTNFNTISSSLSVATKDEVLMYRMQAIDISQFLAKPYFVTLQINKENLGYGLSGSELTLGSSAKSILYPSVVSIKTLIMQNAYDHAYTKLYPAIQSYCAIPPLMIPEDMFVTTASFGIPGLKEAYHSWFTLYVAALTGSLNVPAWNDGLGFLENTSIGLFDISQQQAPARVVIDVSGNLVSGAVLPLVKKDDSFEKRINLTINANDYMSNILDGISSNKELFQDIHSVADISKAIASLPQNPPSENNWGWNGGSGWNWEQKRARKISILEQFKVMLRSYSVDEQKKILAMSQVDITNKLNELSNQRSTLLAQLQSSALNTYMLLMSCDVIDIGSDYHQDIPILNLYKDQTSGSVIANQPGGDWINFRVTFGFRDTSFGVTPTTFAQGYGVPYNNVMLFSLPAADMKNGVIGELLQTDTGNYELVFKQLLSEQQLQELQQEKAQELMNNNPQLTQAAALQQAEKLEYGVLAVQKVFLDASIKNQTQMKIQFLNNTDAGWTSSALIPVDVASVNAGTKKPNRFELTLGTNNTLTAVAYTAPVNTVIIKKLPIKSTSTLPVTTKGSVATSSVATKESVATLPAKKTGSMVTTPVAAQSKKTSPVKSIKQAGSSVVTSTGPVKKGVNTFKMHMASFNQTVHKAVIADPKNKQLKNIEKGAQALQEEFEQIISAI